MSTHNSQIKRCGIKYTAHYNIYSISCYGDSWGIEIPINRLNEFTYIFPEFDWEDGTFLEDIKGTYIRISYDKNFKIISLQHIVKDLTYEVNKK